MQNLVERFVGIVDVLEEMDLGDGEKVMGLQTIQSEPKETEEEAVSSLQEMSDRDDFFQGRVQKVYVKETN